MFDRFTDTAKTAMSRARLHAQNLRHDFIGTEHILLGLLDQKNSRACVILENFGVTNDRVRKEVTKNILIGPELVGSGVFPFTPRTKKVLDYTMDYANERGSIEISTCHLLYGLIRENDGFAAQVLIDCGLTVKEVDRRIRELFVENPLLDLMENEMSDSPLISDARCPPEEKEEVSRKLTFANLLIGQRFILHHSAKVPQDPVFYIHEPVLYIKVSKCNAISVVTEIETIDSGEEVIQIK